MGSLRDHGAYPGPTLAKPGNADNAKRNHLLRVPVLLFLQLLYDARNYASFS